MQLAQYLGVNNGWAFFGRNNDYVAVDLSNFDVTDVISKDEVSLDVEHIDEDDDVQSLALAQFLANEVIFDRTPVVSSARDSRYFPPLSVLTASAQGYADVAVTEEALARVAKRISNNEGMSFDEVRRMARFFLTSPSTDSNALASVYGGEHGKAWALAVTDQVFATEPPTANLENLPPGPDEVPTDPDAPHQFVPMKVNPNACLFCFRDETAEVHSDPNAIDYSLADIDPESAHFYTQKPGDSDECAICGNPAEFTLHRQAALANYYEFRAMHDRIYESNADYWEKKGEEASVTAGGDVSIVRVQRPSDIAESHWINKGMDADYAADTLFWERKGDEDQDDLAYWVKPSQMDDMIIETLYVSDGRDYYELNPVRKVWVKVNHLPADTEPFEIDDDTAAECIRGLVVGDGSPFDMRLADPEEAILMGDLAGMVDETMIDRSLLAASPADGIYTPEERSQNASRQVRDKFGRFAKIGVSVKTPDNKQGSIVLVEPDGRTVHVQHGPDEPAVKYDVKDLEVQSRTDQIRQAIQNIEGKPRASKNTPKAWQDLLLPPLDTNSMIKMMENYPAYVEMMRAGAPDRAKAWDKYDAESRRKLEQRNKQAKRAWDREMEKVRNLPLNDGGGARTIYNKISQWWKEDKARGWVAAAIAAAAAITDPTQSDVPPINMAMVSPTSPDEVLELLSLVPSSPTSSRPKLLRRVEGGVWKEDIRLMRQMQSKEPPTVVVLSPDEFQSVKKQVDQYYTGNSNDELALYDEFGGIIAGGIPGIADTPGDFKNVNRLKRYWTVGKGGAKIRWNTPGDWTRCNRYLRKYMGPRAKGYCFSGDTEFMTRDGTMTLGEAAGTKQFVLTGSKDDGTTSDKGRWVEAEISSFGEQPLLRVTMSRGGIEKVVRATPEHRWFASPNGQNARRFDINTVTTENLRPGMVLASLRHSPVGGDETPDKLAFMAGFVYGDGSKHSPNRSIVDLWGEKMQLQETFAGVASSISTEKELESGVLGVRVHGLPGEWKNAPTLQEDDNYLFGWLAGYLAADGSVQSNGSLVLSSKNGSDMLLVRDICNRLGIAAAVQTPHERYGYNDHPTLLHRVVLRAKTFGPNLLVRKDQREAAQRFFEKSNRGPMLRWKVVSVEDHGEVEEVFCATVPETESFALVDNIWSLNCANLHKLMTGVWPGDRRNVGKKRRRAFSGYIVNTSEGVMSLTAGAAMASGEKAPLTAAAVGEGTPFTVKVLAPVGVRSGDGREFSKEALSHRDLPIPLLWQMQTEDGHNSSVIVGRFDSIEQLPDGSLGNARGVFDTGPYAREAERLVRNKFLRGVSVDLDEFEATTKTDQAKNQPVMSSEEGEEDIMETKISPNDTKITNGRVIAATLVAKPAFQECIIELNENSVNDDDVPVKDGIYIGDPTTEEELSSMFASALIASAIPVHPPKSWFSNPGLDGPSPLTVTDDGRVFGHIATWDTDHIGLPFSTRPPKSRTNYAYFQTGTLRTDEGEDIQVGQITLAGGHAPLESDARSAAQHYDDTASAVCDVCAGEDRHGIWVSGAIRPSVTPEQIRSMRASAPSGDWRPINGKLELVAVCQVNVPGFPVTRARVASGHVRALVAAGTATLNKMRFQTSDDHELTKRVVALESDKLAALAAQRDELAAPFRKIRSDKAEAARARFAAMMVEDEGLFRDYSPESREKMEKKGQAMKDGRYPIANITDLKNAISSYGRGKPEDKPKIRKHIIKRARALGKTDLIPDSWSESSLQVEAEELSARMTALVSGGRYPDGSPWNPKRHPRDNEGRFRTAIASLSRALGEDEQSTRVKSKLRDADDAIQRGDLDKARDAAGDVLELVDAIDIKTEGDILHDVLRRGYKDLGTAVANMPIEMGSLAEKFRFTDLPQDLQGLIEDLLGRVETRLEGDNKEQASAMIKDFMSGAEVLSQPEISAELARMLRYLI